MKLYRFSPIKSDDEFKAALHYVHQQCQKLSEEVLDKSLPVIGNIVIFTHYDDEYEYLVSLQDNLVYRQVNIDSKYFKLRKPIQFESESGVPKASYRYLYIRKPDPYRAQAGDLDLFMEQNEYDELKQKIISENAPKGMRLFPRGDLDMIELFNPDFDVLTYIRPDKID